MLGFPNIIKRIETSVREHQRDVDDITLIAVSKKQPETRIEDALSFGHRIFGENRVQEAKKRWSERRALYPNLKLHLIGPLQTNKVKEAVALFDVIETIDRPKLARKLAKEITAQGKNLELFIQVNIGSELQKAGILPENLKELYEICVSECALNITGLMCIPPFDEDPKPHFQALAKMAEDLGLKHISMGMSSDFEQAIACGATHIRIGSALFGERP